MTHFEKSGTSVVMQNQTDLTSTGPAGHSSKQATARKNKLPKDLVLLQLVMILTAGGRLTYRRLKDDFLLERRTAERYISDLRRAGLPITSRKESEGRESTFVLDPSRNKSLQVEAVDIPPSAARSLSLLLVAAALLPAHLGVKEAVDSTVRAALRLRGMKASTELRRLEDAVIVLENDAKDYGGKQEVFSLLLDATLAGELIEVQYRSPQDSSLRHERFYSATIGLYRGGLYTLAVAEGESGERPVWRALERIVATPKFHSNAPRLEAGVRLRALREARRRWGPARPRQAEDEQLITLHFSERVAPYVQARPWHALAETEVWPASEGGGVRMAIRLAGETAMFESWVRSWGPEVQVLRPRKMAERIADSFEMAAKKHRAAAQTFEESLRD